MRSGGISLRQLQCCAGVNTIRTPVPGCSTSDHQSSSTTSFTPAERNHAPSPSGTYLQARGKKFSGVFFGSTASRCRPVPDLCAGAAFPPHFHMPALGACGPSAAGHSSRLLTGPLAAHPRTSAGSCRAACSKRRRCRRPGGRNGCAREQGPVSEGQASRQLEDALHGQAALRA